MTNIAFRHNTQRSDYMGRRSWCCGGANLIASNGPKFDFTPRMTFLRIAGISKMVGSFGDLCLPGVLKFE